MTDAKFRHSPDHAGRQSFQELLATDRHDLMITISHDDVSTDTSKLYTIPVVVVKVGDPSALDCYDLTLHPKVMLSLAHEWHSPAGMLRYPVVELLLSEATTYDLSIRYLVHVDEPRLGIITQEDQLVLAVLQDIHVVSEWMLLTK